MAAVQRLPILIAVALSSLATPGGLSGGAIEFNYAANSLGGVLAATLSFDGVIYETIATFPRVLWNSVPETPEFPLHK